MQKDLPGFRNREGLDLVDPNRSERTLVDARQTAATEVLIDVRQLVRLKLYERLRTAQVARKAFAARLAFLRVDVGHAIVHPDHLKFLSVGKRAAHHANIPPDRL